MIELINVRKYYLESIGLTQTQLTIPKGQAVAILGEIGSGKSTLLKCIMGITSLTEGKILIGGAPISQCYDQLSYISSEGSYFPSMTPLEYGDFLSQFFNTFNINDYKELLDRFHLEANKKISTLPKPKQLQLEIAAGFAKGTSYLLLDEPFLGQDLFAIDEILSLIAKHQEKGATLLIATHHIDIIEKYVHRALILKRGRIIEDISLDAYLAHTKSLSEVVHETYLSYRENLYS